MEKNFLAGCLWQVKIIFSRGKCCFVPVPPESDKHYNNIPAFASNALLVNYQQGDGQRTCLTYFFANVFHYAGAKQDASEI